jgi:two-component system response regulator HydG
MNPMALRVLIVDDEDFVREMIGETLSARHYETALAASGPEALELLAKQPFDVVLTDVKMPGMEGLELVRRIKRSHPSIHIVVLTGYPRDADIGDFMLQGADDFMPKPFRAADLVAILKRVEQARPRDGSREST